VLSYVKLYEVPFFVALDHVHKAVVVSVRGTLSLEVLLSHYSLMQLLLIVNTPVQPAQFHGDQFRLHWVSCGSPKKNPEPLAPCGLRGCKNGPAPFPGRLSYKATKPGLVLLYILACIFKLCCVY